MRTATRTKTKTKNTRRILAFLIAAALTAAPVWSKKKTKQPEPSAVVAGTVYRSPGYALPDVDVTITPESSEAGGVKFKKEQAITNFRGEFAVRVPPVPMRYTVHVQISGYESQDKTVAIEGEQRQDLSFVLEPKSRATAEEKSK